MRPSLSRVVSPPAPPLQPGHDERSSSTSSRAQQQQQPQPRYPAVLVSPVDHEYPKHRRVEDGQCSSGLIVAQQQRQIAEDPTQPTYGYPSTSLPCDSYHAYQAQTPAWIPPMYAAQIPTTPSQWSSGSITQGQEQHYYTKPAVHSQPTQVYQQPPYTSPMHIPIIPSGSASGPIAWRTPPMVPGSMPLSAPVTCAHSSLEGSKTSLGPAGYSQLAQAQPYPQPPYTSTTYVTPGVVPLANDPSSHRSPQSLWTSLTVPGVAPDSGAGPSSPNINVGGASTIGEPTSPNHQIGPSRRDRTNWRQESKPFKRPTSTSRKTRPITYEGNLLRLAQRCRRQGADEGAIGLLGKIFADGVNLEALTRLLTDAEAETKEFGIETGKIYTAFLESPDEEDTRHICRLCHSKQTWKHHKDVLRHLKRDHFGLADACDQCGKRFYTKNEKRRHPCE